MEYRFRELTTKAELLEHFRLRYKVYRDSKLKNFLAKERIGLDIDRYDLQSKHYALFLISEGDEIMIGGLRTIYEKDQIGKRFLERFLGSGVNKYVQHLPIREYFNFELSDHELDERGIEMEGSRFFISQKYRGRDMFFFLFKSALTLLFSVSF